MVIGLSSVLIAADIAKAQENAPTVEWGKDLFSIYCAPCHDLEEETVRLLHRSRLGPRI